jgi:hypothetical protein
MKMLVLLASIAMGFAAKADGFKCETRSGLIVQIYNHTSASAGTRTGSIMVLSDSKVQYGNKTIASFTAEKQTLSSQTLRYVGKVDLRVKESNRKGEIFAGTNLGHASEIAVTVFFNYAHPTAAGQVMPAEFVVVKRNGDVLTEPTVCERYLKN